MINIIIIFSFIFLAILLVLIARARRNQNINISAPEYLTLRILVPKNNEKTPLAAEQMFAALHGIFRNDSQIQEHLSFEITSKDKYIQFYAMVPDHLKDFVEGQIYAQYPTAEISQVQDYTNISLDDLKIAAAEFTLNKIDVFPIKTFLNFEVDPLAGITGVLSKTGENEQIWLQIIFRPVSDEWQKEGMAYVSAVRAGKSTTKIHWGWSLFASLGSLLGELFRTLAFGPSEPTEKKSETPQLPATVETALAGAETKAAKLGFATKIRAIVFSKDEVLARSKLESIYGAFKQFNTTNMNGFSLGEISSNPAEVENYRARIFQDDGFVFNIEELASLYHLPNISVETPAIVWAGSKKGEPPSNVPVEGSSSSEEVTFFAKTNFRHMVHKFGIKTKDRRLHMYCIGKTGTGKSTLLENMIIDDIRKGKGVAVVDPHGDLIRHILDFIPASRINDVVVFDPSDRDFPLGFNILEQVEPDLKNIVASGVVGIFKKIFGESWGPRLEYILRNSILALLDYPDATLLGIMRILVDKAYRQKVVEKLKDPVIRDFFINEYEKYDPKFRTEAIAPIQNKVGQFLASSTIRNIVGQPESTFNIEDIMNSKKILLLDLSVGKIGEDASALLGAMMITKMQLAAMQRTHIPEEERVDFYLYVDEFQNFATDSFATILSEARKYHLSLIMTNQYIAQMPEIVASAIFGNVGSLISFRVGATDAAALVKEFEPVFEANDMVNLDNYHIYVKMAIDGVTSPAFSSITLPPYKEKNNNREKIVEASRQHFGRDRAYVEDQIALWAQYLDQEDIPSENRSKPKEVQIAKIGDRRFEKLDFQNNTWYAELAGGQPEKSAEEGREKNGQNNKNEQNNPPAFSSENQQGSNREKNQEKDKLYQELTQDQIVHINNDK